MQNDWTASLRFVPLRRSHSSSLKTLSLVSCVIRMWVSHQIRQAGFTDVQVERALDLYKLMIEVLRGAKPYHELETAGQSVRDEDWYQWLAIPPENSYLWAWYPKVGNLDILVFWKQVHKPVLLIYGEHDQFEPADETKIQASLDGVKTLMLL